MGVPYQPGRESKDYHRLSRTLREAVRTEVDRQFREQTGVTRKLNPTSTADLELRRTWLRIRDKVMNQREQKLSNDTLDLQRDLATEDLVTQIPEEMRWLGWKQAATLVETWIERPPAVMPKYSSAVTNVIQMDWVLGFGRAKDVYDTIFREKIWNNLPSQGRIKDVAGTKPAIGEQRRFGDLSQPVEAVNRQWINARPVLGVTAFDGLAGALGRFEFKLSVSGTLLSPRGVEVFLNVEEVGVFVKDSLDFEGDQFLGFWGPRDTPVYNSDFREWRQRNNAGGDFLVFSDVKRTRLNPPELVPVAW